MDNRRQFIGKMFAGGFGLAIGQTVSVQAVEAPKKIEAIPLIPTFPGQLWCHHAEMRVAREPVDVTDMSGYRNFIQGPADVSLHVQFRGPGCADMYQLVMDHFFHGKQNHPARVKTGPDGPIFYHPLT